MLLERPIDQGIEPAVPLVPLDLLVPEPLGILGEPGPDAVHLVARQSLDRGGDLLHRAHRHPRSVGRTAPPVSLSITTPPGNRAWLRQIARRRRSAGRPLGGPPTPPAAGPVR